MAGSLLIAAIVLPLVLSVQAQEQEPASVPPGAQRVTMLVLSFTASCSGDIAIRAVTVTHGGMGAFRDLSSVYAMSGGQRISRGRALSSRDGSVTLTFRPVLTVPACRGKDVAITTDFSVDAAVTGEHRFSLLTVGGIDAGDAIVTLEGGGGAPVRSLAGTAQGSVTAEFLPLLDRVTYGDHRTVARLRLTADGTYDQAVDAITFTNDGSARGQDLQNLTLESGRGQVLARLSSLRGDLASFVLAPPLAMERGQVRLLTVRADVRAGRRRTIGFTLEEPGDLFSHRVQVRK